MGGLKYTTQATGRILRLIILISKITAHKYQCRKVEMLSFQRLVYTSYQSFLWSQQEFCIDKICVFMKEL